MALEEYDFQYLENGAQPIVLEELERALAGAPAGVCRCNDCVVDMAALALNTVKPLYRNSLMGELYTKAARDDLRYIRGVREAVRAAMEKIHANPSHDGIVPPPYGQAAGDGAAL